MSYELLLEWASEVGSGSWEAFKDAHDWAMRAGVAASGPATPSRTIMTMAMLGHIEVDWVAGRWSVAHPAMVMLPAAGGHALLTGGRTRTLLAAVEREISAGPPAAVLEVVRRPQTGAPDAVFLACNDQRDVQALAERLGIAFESSVAERLSIMLPRLDSYLVPFSAP